MQKKYKTILIILAVEYFILLFLGKMGMQVHSWIGNALGALCALAPIFILLYLLGRDENKSKELRVVAKIIMVFLVICYIAGGIATAIESHRDNHIETETESIETETESEAKIMKDVVFLNRPAVGALRGVPRPSAWEKINYESKYPYEYNEAEDGDKLYAFYIYFFSYQKGFGEITPADFPVQRVDESNQEYKNRVSLYGKNRLVEVMKSEGIWVLSECLEKETPVCLIACTMNDLVRVFDSDTSVFRDETNIFSKWDYIITSTQRPDIVEVTTQAGWSEETGRKLESWFWENLEEVQKLIGTEYQVTMSVEVE